MKLDESVRNSILDHARESAPAEACGLLGGREGDPPVVLESIRTANVAEHPTRRFEIDPAALLEGHESIEAANLSLLGFYHSHPAGPPAPSETDRGGAAWPNTHVLIASLGEPEPELAAWWYTGDRFHPVPLEPVE